MDLSRWLRGLLSLTLLCIGFAARAKVETPTCAEQLLPKFTLNSFFETDPEKNLALLHPLTLMNAAEKTNAYINHVPPRRALDPIYRVKQINIYPMLNGENPASGGRMVISQESAIDAFAGFVASAARGDHNGKTIGFPGPAGTGKTELLYVLAAIEKNLGKEDKYKQMSYRFRGLENVPYLRPLIAMDRSGNPINPNSFIDPDLPRSPFTLLRTDMQDEILREKRAQVKDKWGLTVSDGWTEPEPKSGAILKAIFEHEVPEIAIGQMSLDDLSKERYLEILNKYVVVVPKTLLQPKREASMLRAQTENPNYQALFASPNLKVAFAYNNDYSNPLTVSYRGQVPMQDGGLLMIDELFRNPPDFLNVLLDVIQNHILGTDFGAIHLDILPVWNANDESIALARENSAIKAMIDRTDRNGMRLLLQPRQIEAVSLFQVGLNGFKQRLLDQTVLTPINHAEVYPPSDAQGRTFASGGRYAIYYTMGDRDILIAPHALAYMSWIASATRFVTDIKKLQMLGSDLNLITGNSSLFTDEVGRVRIAIGDREVERAELMELARVKDLAKEGATGISSRDIETWLKEAIKIAGESDTGVLTPMMIDVAFSRLLDEERISPPDGKLRADWLNTRRRIKLEMLLPKLEEDVKAITSGDTQRAAGLYREVEQEILALAENDSAVKFTPEDGSAEVPINVVRLNEIRAIYREKFHKDFEPRFLLRNLRGANRNPGQQAVNPDLMDAVKEFISVHDRATASYVTGFDRLYRGDQVDASVRQKAAEVEPLLSTYGYNAEAFKAAVSLVAQLLKEAELERKSAQQAQ